MPNNPLIIPSGRIQQMTDSETAALAGLPWSASGAVNSLVRFFDHFVGGAVDDPWVVVPGGPVLPVFDNVAKGVVKFPGDNVSSPMIWTGKANYYRAAAPIIEVYCYTTAAIDQRIAFARYDFSPPDWNQYQWGIRYNPALSPNWGISNKNGAGADVFFPSLTPVVSGQRYVLRVWLTGAVGAQTINLTIDGADLTQYSAVQPDPSLGSAAIWCSIAGAPNSGLYIDWIGIEADFSQAPA